MHELSLASGMLGIVRDELARHGMHKLLRVRVRFGPLSNIMPEALEMAWASLASDAGFSDAVLEMAEDQLVLVCGECHKEFTPDPPALYAGCGHCGSTFFHSVKSGKELYIEQLEAE